MAWEGSARRALMLVGRSVKAWCGTDRPGPAQVWSPGTAGGPRTSDTWHRRSHADRPVTAWPTLAGATDILVTKQAGLGMVSLLVKPTTLEAEPAESLINSSPKSG